MIGHKSWTAESSGPMPGDNPVYEPGNTDNGGSSAVITSFPERKGNESSMSERKFDSPIYSDIDGETDHDNVYTVPFDQQDQQSQPNHEFDNPIYGTET